MIIKELLPLYCKALNNWADDVKSPMGSDIAFCINADKFILDREFFNLEYVSVLSVDRDGDLDEDGSYNVYDIDKAFRIITFTISDILENSDDSALLCDHLSY